MRKHTVLLLALAFLYSPTGYTYADEASDATEIIVIRILQIRDDVCSNAQVKHQLTCRREYARALAVAKGLETTERKKRELNAAGDFVSAGRLQERIDADFKQINGILGELRQIYHGS